MGSDRYDETLIQILQAEGKIMPFLDVMFGFLQRRTDFYHEHTQPSAVGFPPGVAEQLVVTTFRKWREVQHRSTGAAVPPAAAEELVVTSPAVVDSVTSPAAVGGVTSPQPSPQPPSRSAAPARGGGGGGAADCHNGAARDGYSWSQTIADLTVRVPVPADVRRARQVAVQLRCDRAAVRLAGGAELVSGQLHRAIRPEESTWSILPGDCVQLSLEKARECWWTSLLTEEPGIDIKTIEAVKPWQDLSEEEQMKIGELRAREEAKSRPETAQPAVTAGQGKDVSAMLREAWDAEGSPFRGQPYDPAAVQIIPGVAAAPTADDANAAAAVDGKG